MKKTLVTIIFLASLIAFPAPASAVTADEAHRQSILALIEVLLNQIEVLKAELAAQQEVHIPSTDELMVSQFYDGPYVAVYVPNGQALVPVGKSTPSSAHVALWNGFLELAGDTFVRENIQEFRVYASYSTEYDAFTDFDPETGKWIFAVNTYGLDMKRPEVWEELNPLFVHEIGHIVIDDEVLHAFTREFWDADALAYADRVAAASPGSYADALAMRYYARHESEFVTEYAATSPLEDAVESFVAYTAGFGDFDDGVRADKVLFFVSYPQLTNIKAQIQYSLEK